jgi:hypothetical protein
VIQKAYDRRADAGADRSCHGGVGIGQVRDADPASRCRGHRMLSAFSVVKNIARIRGCQIDHGVGNWHTTVIEEIDVKGDLAVTIGNCRCWCRDQRR